LLVGGVLGQVAAGLAEEPDGRAGSGAAESGGDEGWGGHEGVQARDEVSLLACC